MTEGRPIIGITMGDPASIGPEITLKALNNPDIYQEAKPLVVGDLGMLYKAQRAVGLEHLKFNRISQVSEAIFEYGTIDVLDMGLIDADTLELGKVSKEAGEAAL